MQTIAQRIRSKEFARGRRGFDSDEVTNFLATVADEVEELEAELRRETVRANALERRVQSPEEAEGNLEAAFLAAAETKQKLIDEAQERAREIIIDAREEADRLVEGPRNEARRAQEESSAILLQAKERLESAQREAAAIEERARAEAAQLEADSAERGRRAVEESERRAQESIDAARHEAAIRIAAAQRESADIRSELEAEHNELIDRVRALQTAVVGMLEYGAARSPDLAAVLDPSEDAGDEESAEAAG
ncbi:MAG: DivIVA domain-containing protein [Acidimicrobiia bacterium]|nr:DivIVA domain-containing protein [Acidimicrobiia bacterium]